MFRGVPSDCDMSLEMYLFVPFLLGHPPTPASESVSEEPVVHSCSSTADITAVTPLQSADDYQIINEHISCGFFIIKAN